MKSQNSKTVTEQIRGESADKKRQLLTDIIRNMLVEFLELDSIEDVALDQNFIALGTSSTEAVAFKIKLENLLACSFRTTLLFDYPSLDILADYLLIEIGQKESQVKDQLQVNPESKVFDKEELPVHAVAIVAMEGTFPGIVDSDGLWERVLSGEKAVFPPKDKDIVLTYGELANPEWDSLLSLLGITSQEYYTMERPLQLFYKVLARAMNDHAIDLKELSSQTTGLFIASSPDRSADSDFPRKPYRITLPNAISFRLNFQGPSEQVNTFCTSVYVALHRAVQSIRLGEVTHAIVGGINLIEKQVFKKAAIGGLYDDLLSPGNNTKSFCQDADGFVRSEGLGLFILKPLALARSDGNKILAVIRGTAVHHGGSGFSIEAPNVKGMKVAMQKCIHDSGINVDTIDYVEAHGIANPLADALELCTIDQVYRSFSNQKDKKWIISSIKPSIGHPEIAAGAGSMLKVIRAMQHGIIPGNPGITTLNQELPDSHSLIIDRSAIDWKVTSSPRRAALNSFAIGGVNAHVILEQYSGGNFIEKKKISGDESDTQHQLNEYNKPLDPLVEDILRQHIYAIFHLNPEAIDWSRSPVYYGFDSIKTVQLIRRINQSLGINIKLGQALSLDSFQDFFELVEKYYKLRASIAEPLLIVNSLFDKTEQNYPISQVQKGLWYIQESNPSSSGFNVPIAFKIEKSINSDLLSQTLKSVLQKYPILTANLVQHSDTDELVHQFLSVEQIALAPVEIVLKPGQIITDVMFSLLREPFDVKSEPLIKWYLFSQENSSTSYLYFIIHHIIIDGFSGVRFMRVFWDNYHLLSEGNTPFAGLPDYAFFDFVRWEQTYLNSNQAIDDLAWWKEKLAGIGQPPSLPYDYRSDFEMTGVGCEKTILTGDRLVKLKDTARKLQVSISTLMLAIFNVLLYKITGEEDIMVSTPVGGRPEQAHEQSVGCYINLMISRNKVSEEKGFDSLLKEVRDNFNDGLNHAFYPFTQLTSSLGIKMNSGIESPLPVSYTYQNIFDEILDNKDFQESIQPLFEVYQETEDHYTLEVYDFRDSLEIQIKYQRNLFEEKTIHRHLGYLDKLLQAVVKMPQAKIKDYDILEYPEKKQLTEGFNSTGLVIPNLCIHEMIEEQARHFPDNIALIDSKSGEIITYRVLEEQSTHIAHFLQSQGVKPDFLIGLSMERSSDAIITLLGILKAGGAYLFIDPLYEEDRIRFMMKDAKVNILLTQEWLIDRLTPAVSELCLLWSVDQILKTPRISDSVLEKAVLPAHLAYVIYTSGSTGRPKGVMIEHLSLVNLCVHLVQQYKIVPSDRILQFASLSFDMSVEEIFPYLIAGAGIVIRSEQDINPNSFYQVIIQKGVTILNIPPLFYDVIERLDDDQQEVLFAQIRLISVGGEAIPEKVWSKLRTLECVQTFNAYGPTEYTVNTTIAEIRECEQLTIGKPIANTQVYVLGKNMELLPIGVKGELYIAGAGLTRGYLNRDELNAEKFFINPFGEGNIYRTGDRACWLDDGNLQFLNRLDDQVKVRGYRVELGEIENVLAEYEGIKNAVVISKNLSGENILTAFYISEIEYDPVILRIYLLKKMPEYMVPAIFMKLDDILLTPNGKADRKALANLSVSYVRQKDYVGPRTGIELSIVKIWQEELAIGSVSVMDDFFDLGGHSLVAIRIMLRINKTWKADLSLGAFLKAGNVRELSVFVEKGGNERLSECLISLREPAKDSDNVPIFVIPGLPGLCDGYYGLAKNMCGTGHVYGLQMQGHHGKSPCYSIGDMAEHNIELIEQIVKAGPVKFFAHSYGGTILYEMLRKLEFSDISVVEIVMIDSGILSDINGVHINEVILFCNLLFQGVHLNERKEILQKIQDVLSVEPESTWENHIEQLIVEKEFHKEALIFAKCWKVVKASLSVNYAYPHGKLPYPLKLIIAEESKDWLKPDSWNPYFNKIDVYHAKGDHMSVIRPPFCNLWLNF